MFIKINVYIYNICNISLSHVSSHQRLIPPAKQQFSCYNLIETSFFLPVVIASVLFYINFMLFVHTDYANFDFNQCSVLAECCF